MVPPTNNSTINTMGDEKAPQSSAEVDAFVEDLLEQMVRTAKIASFKTSRFRFFT
jgi:hypothetical protein